MSYRFCAEQPNIGADDANAVQPDGQRYVQFAPGAYELRSISNTVGKYKYENFEVLSYENAKEKMR